MSEDPPSGPQRPALRASDEDRERLISQLNEHAVAGRLSTEEFEERLQAAYAAKTTHELQELRDDLPLTSRETALSHARHRRVLMRRLVQETGGSLGLFVVSTAVWLISGAHGQFWPVWVLIVVVMSLVRNGWSLFGPAPDPDAVEAHLDAQRVKRLDRHQRRSERRGGRRLGP